MGATTVQSAVTANLEYDSHCKVDTCEIFTTGNKNYLTSNHVGSQATCQWRIFTNSKEFQIV